LAEREGLLVAGCADGFEAEAYELGGDVVHREAMAAGAGAAALEEVVGEKSDVGADAALGEDGGFAGARDGGKEREGGDGGERERAEAGEGDHGKGTDCGDRGRGMKGQRES